MQQPCAWKACRKASATAGRRRLGAARYLDGSRFGLRAAHGSASVKDGKLCVTAVYTHLRQTIDLEVETWGASWGGVEVVTLEGEDIRAHNTFAQPEQVRLSAPRLLQAENNVARLEVAPGGVVRLRGTLA